MRDKIISILIGALVGGVFVYGYSYFLNQDISTVANATQRPSFDASNMSDDQLEKMASRAGLSTEELKQKLDSGEDLRSLMGANRSGGEGTSFNNNSN